MSLPFSIYPVICDPGISGYSLWKPHAFYLDKNSVELCQPQRKLMSIETSEQKMFVINF